MTLTHVACILAAVVGCVVAALLERDTARRARIRRHGSGALLVIALALPQWHQDRCETAKERRALVAPVVTAIETATASLSERAWLLVQAWYETRLARYVLEDRCKDGPIGAQCDRGKARGPWQVHGHCNGAWNDASTHPERLLAGARCALRGYHWGRRRCKGALAGAFAAQRSALLSDGDDWCAQPWAVRRVSTWLTIRSMM